MSRGGIISPWVERAQPEENPLENATAGTQPVRFNGRAYALVVALPFRLKDEEKALGIATQTLGECLNELREVTPLCVQLLQKQKITFDQRPLSPCVELDLGVLTLYAVASSTDERLARAMAIDRLALALSTLVVSDPRCKATLSTYRLNILRIA